MIGGITKRLKDLKKDLAAHTGRPDPRQDILEKAAPGSVYYSQPNPEVVQANGFKIYIKYSPHGLNVVEWGTEDAPKKSITVNSYIWTRKVVELIQRKSPMRFVRAYASMNSQDYNQSHDETLFEMWKNSPCMHSGIPNKQAMRLLVGLRKNIPKGWVMMKGGNTAYPDRSVAQLVDATLVEQTDKGGLVTTLQGYQVLRHWAETRGSFEPYLAAYLPKNWETEYTSRKVFDAMAGGSNEGSVGFRDVYR